MIKKTTLHRGLDVHKEAIPEGSRNCEVRIHSTISDDLHALEKRFARARKAHRKSYFLDNKDIGDAAYRLVLRSSVC